MSAVVTMFGNIRDWIMGRTSGQLGREETFEAHLIGKLRGATLEGIEFEPYEPRVWLDFRMPDGGLYRVDFYSSPAHRKMSASVNSQPFYETLNPKP